MEKYSAARDAGMLRLTKEQAHALGVSKDVSLQSMAFSHDPLVVQASARMAPARNLATYLEKVLVPGLERAVFLPQALSPLRRDI